MGVREALTGSQCRVPVPVCNLQGCRIGRRRQDSAPDRKVADYPSLRRPGSDVRRRQCRPHDAEDRIELANAQGWIAPEVADRNRLPARGGFRQA